MAREVRLPAGVAMPPPPRALPTLGQLAPRIQLVLAVAAVFLYAGVKLQLSAAPAATELGAVDPVNRLLQLLLLLGCGGLVAVAGRRALGPALALWPFLLLLLFIACSATWSDSPGHTLRRSLGLLAMVTFLLATGSWLTVGRFLRVLLGTSLVLIALSLMEAVLRPAVGFDTGEYSNAIRGVFPQKNVFGMALLFAALALSYVVMERGHARWTDGAMLLLLLAMLVLARSTTSLLLTMVTAAVTMLVLWIDRGGAWLATAALAAAVALFGGAVVFAGIGVEGFFDLIGKDSSLTGRTFIWAGVWELIDRRPLLGYGYAAFWLDGSRNVAALVEAVQWDVPNAHSGYLEVLLQLGWAGMWLVILLAAVTLGMALRAALAGRVWQGLWAVLVLAMVLILNRTESVMLNPDYPMVFWLLALLALRAPARA